MSGVVIPKGFEVNRHTGGLETPYAFGYFRP